MRIHHLSQSEAQTIDFAASLGRALRSGDIVTLEGPLGAGKTCFVRGLARGLGLDPTLVASPTFIICREYEDGAGMRLAHIDAYRLRSADDLQAIGWEELLAADGTAIAIEWPSRIASAIPARRVAVTLAHAGDTLRRIEVDIPDSMESQMEHLHGKDALA